MSVESNSPCPRAASPVFHKQLFMNITKHMENDKYALGIWENKSWRIEWYDPELDTKILQTTWEWIA